MVKVSPMVRSFNGGEFSALMEGRTDIDRYPASMRKLFNFVAAPQGPAIGRSGTRMVVPVARHDEESVIVEFLFSSEQTQLLELAGDRIRFITEAGIQVYDMVSATAVATTPFQIDSASLSADIGDDVVLTGYPSDYGLNDQIGRVTAKVGTVYTLDTPWPTGKSLVAASASRVYHVALDYTLAERKRLRVLQSVDVMYLLNGNQPRKLSRYGAYDWRLELYVNEDGPYMPVNETPTTLSVDRTGNAIPVMTGNSAPSGDATASGSRPSVSSGSDSFLDRLVNYALFAAEPYYAFGADDETYWAGDAIQKGKLSYEFDDPVTIDGYTIVAARDNQDPDYLAKDYAPSTFELLGSNDGGVTYDVIDSRTDYVAYDNSKTIFFELDNPVSYAMYTLDIKKLYRNGQIEPRVRRFILRATDRGIAQPILPGGLTTITNADANAAVAFDGLLQPSSSATRKNATVANSVYIGKTMAVPAAIKSARVFGSNDLGFTNGGANVTATLYGKSGSAPANGTDGTVLGSALTATDPAGVTLNLTSNDTSTYWDHVWINITQAANTTIWIAEVDFNGWTEQNYTTVTASSVVGINKDQGFLPTDVGRLIRMKASDNTWRPLRINAWVSSTEVRCALEGEPFPDLREIKQWRLGYWSDTTGWPTCGEWLGDRLVLNGGFEYPDMFALSETGRYEAWAQTDANSAVLDDSAMVFRLNARKLSPIRWLASDEKGLLMGTGSVEWIGRRVRESEGLTARNFEVVQSTSRGSADVEPVKVDRQVVYVQRSGRTLRELAYVFEADGYKSPSMSQLASHLGVQRFVEMAYAAEPYSIIWVRREDGSVVGLTYNRDENVVGWHRHDFAGAIVESIAVLPQLDQSQDALWIVANRTINGQTRRYIEQLTRFWDFDIVKEDAVFVDCSIRFDYEEPTLEIYVPHLNGETVYGLGDGKPFGPLVVTDSKITLSQEVSYGAVGLGFDAEGETSRLDNGAQDGTAIGKVGRAHNVSLLVWDTYGGEIGMWDAEALDPVTDKLGMVRYVDLKYPRRADVIEETDLYTGESELEHPFPGYEKKNTISFRRPKEDTLPFNIVAVMPQLDKQDRS